MLELLLRAKKRSFMPGMLAAFKAHGTQRVLIAMAATTQATVRPTSWRRA